jgi:hydroxymethylpyrimidine/phosphomethylpyrimidine kinase
MPCANWCYPAEVLVGSHQAMTDFCLPEWDAERPPSARELAVAAAERGTRHVLVTGLLMTAGVGSNSSTTCSRRRGR